MDNIGPFPDDNRMESKLKSIFLFNAVNDVVKSMAATSMNEVKIMDVKEVHYNEPCVSGVSLMKGSGQNAMLIITLPTGSAFNLVSSFTGMHVSELTPNNICDGVVELTNMVCGKIKSQLAQLGYELTNSHCLSIYGQNYYILNKSKLKNIAKKYKASNLEMVLRILFI